MLLRQEAREEVNTLITDTGLGGQQQQLVVLVDYQMMMTLNTDDGDGDDGDDDDDNDDQVFAVPAAGMSGFRTRDWTKSETVLPVRL